MISIVWAIISFSNLFEVGFAASALLCSLMSDCSLQGLLACSQNCTDRLIVCKQSTIGCSDLFRANYEGWIGQREGQSQNASNCLLLLVLVNLGGIELISIEERSHHHNTALVVRSRSGISVVSLAWYQRKRSVWRVLGISDQCGHISGLEYTHRSPLKSATP